MSYIRDLAFLIFEVIVFTTSYRLAKLLSGPGTTRVASGRRAERLLSILLMSFVISHTFALILTFAKLNDAWTYLGAAVLGLGLAYGFRYGLLREDLKQVAQILTGLDSAWIRRFLFLGVLAIPLLGTLIFVNSDVDTLSALTTMINWFQGRSTPYSELLWNTAYPSFWELTYLPSIAITHSLMYLWWGSLKADATVFLGVYALARALEINEDASFLLAIAPIVSWTFTAGPATGIPSVKGDMLIAGCFIAIVLAGFRIVQGRADRPAGLLMWLALVGLSSKYSGVILGAMAVVLTVLFVVRQLRPNLAHILRWGVLAVVGVVGTTGHYYIRNLLWFHNPFWPATITFAGHTLFPGTFDLSGTSIVEHLFERGLWQVLFTWFHFDGFYFALIFVGSLLLPLVCALVVLGARLFQYDLGVRREYVFLVGIAWIGMLVFIATPLSAGVGQDVYHFLPDLGSFRYGMGAMVLGELILLWLLSRMGLGQGWLAVLAGVAIGARLQQNVQASFVSVDKFQFIVLFASSMCILGLAAALYVHFNYNGRLRLMAVLGLIVLAGIPQFVPIVFQRNQPIAWNMWGPAWATLADSPAVKVGLAYDTHSAYPSFGSNPLPIRAVVAGDRLQNNVQFVSDDLEGVDSAQFDYLVWLQHIYMPVDEPGADNFARLVTEQGFTVEANTGWVVIASRKRP